MLDRMFSFLGDQIGIKVLLNYTIPIVIITIIGLVVYLLVIKNKEKEFTNTNMALLFIAVFLIVFLPIVGFGIFRAWYYSTGYPEVNHPSYKPQETTYPLTVAQTVPTVGLEPDASTRKKARALKNPVPATARSLALGKNLFQTYCKPCHGKNGYGQGLMGSVPMLRPKPIDPDEEASLKNYLGNFMGYKPEFKMDFVQKETEGDIYYTITNGGEAIMPSFSDALSPEMRWTLINYIKKDLGRHGDD